MYFQPTEQHNGGFHLLSETGLLGIIDDVLQCGDREGLDGYLGQGGAGVTWELVVPRMSLARLALVGDGGVRPPIVFFHGLLLLVLVGICF